MLKFGDTSFLIRITMTSYLYLPLLVVSIEVVSIGDIGKNEDTWKRSYPELGLAAEEFTNGKIAGGEITTIEKFPYQVSIKVNNFTICGGFILSSTWVMTSAYCIDGVNLSLITVRAGSSVVDSGGTVFQVRRVVIHSLFNATKGNDYDFGLVSIDGTFIYGSTIKNIGIPKQNAPVRLWSTIIVSGWGLTADNTPYSQELRTATIKYVNKKLCRFLYNQISLITDRMFCAGKLLHGRKGSCQGDIGGPAVNQNGVAIGIVSFGVICGSPIFPSVFANIASVSEWVIGITGIK